MVTGAHGELVAYGAFTVVPGHPKHVKREMDRMRERRATVLAQADYFQALAELYGEADRIAKREECEAALKGARYDAEVTGLLHALAAKEEREALAEWQEESEAERSGPVAVKAEPWSGPWTEGKVR